MAITYRSEKGLPLTSTEIDANFAEVEAIGDGQFSNALVYSTYAIMVATSGVANTSYKVSNDSNTALNGYYHYSGGWVKDADLANGVIEESNSDAVSGGTVFDYFGKTKLTSVVYNNPNEFININTTTKAFEFPSTFFLAGLESIGLLSINALSDIPYTDGYIMNVLYADLSTNTVGLAEVEDVSYATDPKKVFLAAYIPSKNTLSTNGFDISVNGVIPSQAPDLILGKNAVSLIYSEETDAINFNFVTNEIEFPSTFYITGQNGIDFTSFNSLANLPVTPSFVIGILWFDSLTNTIGVSDKDDVDYFTDISKQVIASFIPSRKTVTTNGFRYKLNGISSSGGTDAYNESLQRLILPDKIFITDYPLSIYKEGLTASKLYQDNNFITLKDERSVLPIEPSIVIDNTLPSTVTIIQTPKESNGFFYRKDITVVSTDATTKTGAKTILCLGDSLTNRGIAARVKTKIESISSVTLTPIGTMSNQEGASGEGREGWEFENFIGKDNTYNSTPIIRQTTAGTSSLTLNPFLKLADATDKSTNPDWCFTNTGSELETSYTDNATLGDYYIFDWAFYFTTQAITAPDVLTIALSTNDLLKTVDWFENCSLGLEIMLKQLDKYCIDNATTIDVGIVPTPAWGFNDDGIARWSEIAEWTERALFDINSYTFTNITADVVAVWMHQNGQSSFEENNTSIGNVATYSTVNKVGFVEYVHFGTEAKNQYADILSAYVINKL